jgi:branched-chain amino acid aminotransferase
MTADARNNGASMSKQFPATEWIWRNGEIVPWEAATIHVMSHVVHYGSSVFEGIRCYATPAGPAIFRLDAHLRRFHDSCRIYRIPLAFDSEALGDACAEVVRRNNLDECYIRPLALRGLGAAGVNPTGSPTEIYIICWRWGTYLGEGALERGIDTCVSSWRRAAPDTFPMLAKAGGHYLNSQLMKLEAAADGYAEAIALSSDGMVSEGSGENIFIVRDGKLVTPPSDGSLLMGITRDAILTLAKDLAIPVVEQRIPRELLYTADEVFLTGTAAEITPVRSVDKVVIGAGVAGPVTRQIQQEFLGIAHGTREDRHGWRTPVTMPVVMPV